MKANREKWISALLVAIIAVTLPLAGTPAASESAPATAEASATNPSALHDPDSSAYDGRCLSCHQDVLKKGSSDPRILPFHQAMLPYVPGYNPRKGAQDRHCVVCHDRAIDFNQGSGSSLRRNVSVESCVYCHGRSGPGPTYY